MYRVEHRELTAQRTHGAGNVERFPLQPPPLHIHSLFRLFCQSHYDYAKELFSLGGATPPTSRAKSPETALAHVICDRAEQAYLRSDALEKRRKLMNA
jgi:hypothetical protein